MQRSPQRRAALVWTGLCLDRLGRQGRRALRTALLESPEEIYGVIERLMLEDLTSRTLAPGMPRPELSARAWLETRSRLQNFNAAVRHAWGTAGILDELIQNRPQEARARACLMLLQSEQVAIDKGAWSLAAEASLALSPPFHSFAAHMPVDPSEKSVSRLLDSRWCEVFMQRPTSTASAGASTAAGRTSSSRTARAKMHQRPSRRRSPRPRAGPKLHGRPQWVESDEPGDLKVPGSGAPTILVGGLVNSRKRSTACA